MCPVVFYFLDKCFGGFDGLAENLQYKVILQVIILMKAKPSTKQKKATAARKPAGKVKMSATAWTDQPGRPYTCNKILGPHWL